MAAGATLRQGWQHLESMGGSQPEGGSMRASSRAGSRAGAAAACDKMTYHLEQECTVILGLTICLICID